MATSLSTHPGPEARRARQRAGVSLEAMACRLHRDPSSLSRFERGQAIPRDLEDVLEAYGSLAAGGAHSEQAEQDGVPGAFADGGADLAQAEPSVDARDGAPEPYSDVPGIAPIRVRLWLLALIVAQWITWGMGEAVAPGRDDPIITRLVALATIVLLIPLLAERVLDARVPMPGRILTVALAMFIGLRVAVLLHGWHMSADIDIAGPLTFAACDVALLAMVWTRRPKRHFRRPGAPRLAGTTVGSE